MGCKQLQESFYHRGSGTLMSLKTAFKARHIPWIEYHMRRFGSKGYSYKLIFKRWLRMKKQASQEEVTQFINKSYERIPGGVGNWLRADVGISPEIHRCGIRYSEQLGSRLCCYEPLPLICGLCGEPMPYMYSLSDTFFCSRCRGNYFKYCRRNNKISYLKDSALEYVEMNIGKIYYTIEKGFKNGTTRAGNKRIKVVS